MKVVIFHATDCKPEDFWYQWPKQQLEHDGYEVELPYYSDINRISVTEFLPKVLKAHAFDEETILIGHSAGVPLILSILENIDKKIARAILVAGYYKTLPESEDPILQTEYDWQKIKQHADDFVFINSDNDPWGCDDKQGQGLFNQLGGTLIVRHDGHFGSKSLNQSYDEFPLLKSIAEAKL